MLVQSEPYNCFVLMGFQRSWVESILIEEFRVWETAIGGHVGKTSSGDCCLAEVTLMPLRILLLLQLLLRQTAVVLAGRRW